MSEATVSVPWHMYQGVRGGMGVCLPDFLHQIELFFCYFSGRYDSLYLVQLGAVLNFRPSGLLNRSKEATDRRSIL
jgi:hypothetical protein